MKIKRNKIQKGFSLMEIMFVLIILGGSLVGAAMLYNNIKEKANYTKQATDLDVYAKKVANYVNANQAVIYSSGTALKTINSEQLMKYGYLKSVKQLDFHDSKTGATLYPCTAVYVQNGHVEGFTYFRTDNVNLSRGNLVEATKMKASIDGLGATGGIINTNNGTLTLRSINGSWSFDSNVVNQYFTKDGQDYLKIQGLSASCKGAYVANPGVVILMNKYFKDINAEVRNDNTVNQNGNNFVSSNNDNSMTSLNLDSKNAISDLGDNNTHELSSTRNALVFETNKNCVMDPTKLSTMQNYDASFDDGCSTMSAGKCSQITKPNKFGCRNKQLSLAYGGVVKTCIEEKIVNGVSTCKRDINLDSVATYGFNDVNSGKNIQNAGLKIDGNLGGTTSKSIQTSALVEYSSPCSIDEIGAVAKQKPSNTPPTNQYQKIIDQNQGVLVCQKNPMCSDNEAVGNNASACWLPSSKLTIKITWSPSDKVISFTAPKGFVILNKKGFEPEFTSKVMNQDSFDIRTAQNGAKGWGSGYPWNWDLSGDGHHGSGVNLNGYASARCNSRSCLSYVTKPWVKCIGAYSSSGWTVSQPAFKQANGGDYIYFSSKWLNPTSVSTNLNINKGFDGGKNGYVYVDSSTNQTSPLSKDIIKNRNNWQTDASVFKWTKKCIDPMGDFQPLNCNVVVDDYVDTQNCNGNCMVQQQFSYVNGYPKSVNSKFALRTTSYSAQGSPTSRTRDTGCNNWLNALPYTRHNSSTDRAPEIFAYPYYLTSVTITNDLSQVAYVSNITPAPKPTPPDCSPSKIPQATKDTLIGRIQENPVFEGYTQNNRVYSLYKNPAVAVRFDSYQSGNSCIAKAILDMCYINDNNQCKYYFAKTSGQYSFKASENSNMANSIGEDRTDDGVTIGDFSQNKRIYFSAYQGSSLIESSIDSGITTNQASLSNRNLDNPEKQYNIRVLGGNAGTVMLELNGDSCNVGLACDSPAELKNMEDIVEEEPY